MTDIAALRDKRVTRRRRRRERRTDAVADEPNPEQPAQPTVVSLSTGDAATLTALLHLEHRHEAPAPAASPPARDKDVPALNESRISRASSNRRKRTTSTAQYLPVGNSRSASLAQSRSASLATTRSAGRKASRKASAPPLRKEKLSAEDQFVMSWLGNVEGGEPSSANPLATPLGSDRTAATAQWEHD